MSKLTLKGADAFHTHFQSRFGDRWPALQAALLAEGRYAVPEGLIKDYHMDNASLLAAQALQVQPGMKVLDLCAAPGGKSLVLAMALGDQGELVSNEISDARRARLWRVLDEHLPPQTRALCQVTGRDGSRYGLMAPATFDRVLCDVPCGSEAHVLASPEHLSEWGPKRSKQLAVRQYALLCAGFDALKPGGVLVYSTCSLSAEENWEVCAKLSKKRKGFHWDNLSQEMGEDAEMGKWILPDAYPGEGPIFWARLTKEA